MLRSLASLAGAGRGGIRMLGDHRPSRRSVHDMQIAADAAVNGKIVLDGVPLAEIECGEFLTLEDLLQSLPPDD